MEKRSSKSTQSTRNSLSGFYCDIDIGYSKSIRSSRGKSRASESSRNRESAGTREKTARQ